MYKDNDGVQYSDDKKTLLKCPKDFHGEYVIPDGVTSIEMFAFEGCTNLTSITIPAGVKIIDQDAFGNCPSLSSIVVAPDNTIYDSRNGCNAIIKTATDTLILGCKNTIIPDSVSYIGHDAFKGCTGLTSIEIPKSVLCINNDAFSCCRGLETITFKGSPNLNWEAFYCCDLKHVIIPKGTKEHFLKQIKRNDLGVENFEEILEDGN